jgi:hypothetical protein
MSRTDFDPWVCENARLCMILKVDSGANCADQMKRFVEGTDRGQSTFFS